MSGLQNKFGLLLILLVGLKLSCPRVLTRRSISDDSVTRYLTERICVWNEVCKEEFQIHFKCKCPEFFFCRAPGRYYNAFCSMTGTGYIWMQPSFQAADI
ncbi:uncharacterized protein LOC123307781 [Coccinella septempunctata]|uniref:uncharacterized protein LOC123307781 n=1 Tax=Coccinella septempunctata TaxID=41139 RepID=UPI001D06337D|nr:uncharacterized protein LOC123307781 [Coccinella septempunctata]